MNTFSLLIACCGLLVLTQDWFWKALGKALENTVLFIAPGSYLKEQGRAEKKALRSNFFRRFWQERDEFEGLRTPGWSLISIPLSLVLLVGLAAVSGHAAIQYAGGTNINSQDSGHGGIPCPGTLGTKQELANCHEDNLNAAGWTTNSGHHTSTIVLQSATTPAGLNMILTITAGTNCIILKGSNVAATKGATTGQFLLPAVSKVFRIIADKYQYFVSTDGAAAARSVAAGGVFYTPTFSGVTEGIWTHGDAISDTDTNIENNWKCALQTITSVGSCTVAAPNFWVTVNGTQWESIAGIGAGQIGLPHFIIPFVSYMGFNAATGRQWIDGSSFISEPLLSIGSTVTSAGSVVGQLWDAAIITASIAAELPLTLDSHNYLAYTNSVAYTTAQTPVATLVLVVP